MRSPWNRFISSMSTSKAASDVSSTKQKLTVVSFAFSMIIASIAICYYVVPTFIHVGSHNSTDLERILFGLKCCAFSSLPLLVGIQVVANQRLYSSQINPMGGTQPSYRFQVNNRFVSNTAEQYLLLVAGTMGACATASIDLRFIFTMNLIYIVGRFLFWIGYHIEPTRRAAGMSLTFFSTYSLCIYAAFLFIRDDLPGLF